MKFRKFIVLILAIAIVVSVFYLFEILSSVDTADNVSFSPTESKNHNVFIKEVKTIPNHFVVNSKDLKIRDCWIEEKSRNEFKFVFFPTVKKLGSYQLCLTFDNPVQDLSNIYLKRQGSKYGFWMVNGKIYVDDLKSLEILEINETKIDILFEKNIGDLKKISEIRIVPIK